MTVSSFPSLMSPLYFAILKLKVNNRSGKKL